MIRHKVKGKRFTLLLILGIFSFLSAWSQEYHFIAEYGIFTDKYQDLNKVETHVDSFEYRLDVPLRDGMLLEVNMGVEWDDIDKNTRKVVKAVITRPYDPPLRLVKMDKVKFSGSKRLKSLLFKGVFRSGSKLVRVDMYLPLPKI